MAVDFCAGTFDAQVFGRQVKHRPVIVFDAQIFFGREVGD
jgi:hypothetical protein